MGDDIWNIMFAYDKWHFQYHVGEIFSFKFELAIKGILVLTI
jgi:hypothetical protein